MALEELAGPLALLAVVLVLSEWSYVIWWTRTIHKRIVSGVVTSVTNLRKGRGTAPTAAESLADEAGAGGEGAPPDFGSVPMLAGIDPRAIQEGLPIAKKFLDGKPLTPEESMKGLQLLAYANRKMKEAGVGGGGQGAPAGEMGGWA